MAEGRMAVLDLLRKTTGEGNVDVLREGVRVLAAAVMKAKVSELTGSANGERGPDRRLTNRNGYRERPWDTRVGTIGLAISKSATAATSRSCSSPDVGPSGPSSRLAGGP